MTRPAEEPGTPLEPTGNGRPREMVTHDRIRLTGLLRKSPGNGAFLFLDVSRCITSSRRERVCLLGQSAKCLGLDFFHSNDM